MMTEIGQITLNSLTVRMYHTDRTVMFYHDWCGVQKQHFSTDKECMLRILSQNEDVWKDLVQYREEHLCERNK
jgi:hypothetical protein